MYGTIRINRTSLNYISSDIHWSLFGYTAILSISSGPVRLKGEVMEFWLIAFLYLEVNCCQLPKLRFGAGIHVNRLLN